MYAEKPSEDPNRPLSETRWQYHTARVCCGEEKREREREKKHSEQPTKTTRFDATGWTGGGNIIAQHNMHCTGDTGTRFSCRVVLMKPTKGRIRRTLPAEADLTRHNVNGRPGLFARPRRDSWADAKTRPAGCPPKPPPKMLTVFPFSAFFGFERSNRRSRINKRCGWFCQTTFATN